VADTENDFIPYANCLVARDVTANVGLIHRLIEFADDLLVTCRVRGVH
jgi:hypothetical protein